MKSALSCLLRALTLLLLTMPFASAQGQPAALAEGQQLLQAGKPKEALAVFEAFSSASPQNASAWFYVGYCRHMLGDLDGALPAHKRAAKLASGQTQQLALYNTACVYSLKGELDEAFSWLDRLKASGYQNPAQFAADPDLAKARADARWATFMSDVSPDVSPFVETDVRVLHAWKGKYRGEQYGWVAAEAGDVDADGTTDVVVGAPFHSNPQSSGRAYVVSGKTGAELFELAGEPGDRLGHAVDDAGDLNADGHADFLASAPGHAAVPGRVLVYSGADGSTLLELNGTQPGESFGDEAACFADESGQAGGDVDGDGKPDYIVGAPKYDTDAENGASSAAVDAGRVYVLSGADGRVLATLTGERAGDAFGSSAAGRIVDGEPLLVIGAMNAGEAQGGRVYVYKGALTGAERAPAFVLEGDATAVNYGRFFLSIPGDLNADGTLDIYSADFENTANGPNTGRAYVHSGADGSLIYEWTGGAAGSGFGIGNADAGDQNGDGIADLVIGAWQNSQGSTQGGKVYVFSGADGSLVRAITGAIAGDALGFDATSVADRTGDGVRELLITAAYHAGSGPQTGATYLVQGGVGQ